MSVKKRYQKFDSKLAKEILEKTDGHCYYCKSLLPENKKLYAEHGGPPYMEIRQWHIDHLEPVSKGGKDDFENLVPACISCNLKKHNKTAIEFEGNTP